MPKRTLAAVALLAISLYATRGLATPNFPPGIKNDLMLSYEPQCSLCHTNGVTGLGTVHTPFGESMRARGLVPYDDASLSAALAKMKADNVDSDGDGVPDIEELVQGNDPDVPDKGKPPSAGGPVVAYGCGAQIAGGGVPDQAGWLTLIALLAFRTARTDRRRRA
jgi:hypothetical protein